jgi:S1-C subfamily serine protease
MDGGLYKEAETMQIDAPIFGGNSGGAVVNAHGEAVGIVSYGSVSFTQSIPISSALAEIAKH